MSLPVILYLSRHGQTLNNRLQDATGKWHIDTWKGMPDLKELTPEGRRQALVLAKYAGLFIFDGYDKEQIGVLASCEQRSKDTAEIIIQHNRLGLANYQDSPLLKEEVPKEIITPPADASEGYMRWFSGLMPREQIVERFTGELEHYLKRLDCKVVIAPLHGNVNMAFMEHIGLEPFLMGNCSVLPLKYDDGKFTQVGDYLSNKDLEKMIEE